MTIYNIQKYRTCTSVFGNFPYLPVAKFYGDDRNINAELLVTALIYKEELLNLAKGGE